MFEKIKYCLSRLLKARQVRVAGVAILTAVTIASITLLHHSIKTVNVFDGENRFTVHTVNPDIAHILSRLDLKSSRYKILKTSSNMDTTDVEIGYTFPVYITVGDETQTIEFLNGTVKEALLQAGFTPDEHDLVEPAVDKMITKTTYIDYMDIEYVTGSYTEEIPFTTKTVYDFSKSSGYSSLKNGKNGLREVSYTEKYVNGAFIEKKVSDKKVIKKPVNAVKTVGTKTVSLTAAATAKIKKGDGNTGLTNSAVKCVSTLTPASPIKLDANGIPLKYKSKMTSRATAYTYTGHNCSTGVAPQPGYIAVNPKVIPYGTKMYIRTADGSFIYGYAVAADTGGFIRNHPTGVDLFMATESACCSFGVRNVEIYILE